MKVIGANGKKYQIPCNLNSFQQKTYLHLIEWKWQNVTTTPGTARGYYYDAILPEQYHREHLSPLIYPGVALELARHRSLNPFRIHLHFYHMASSQAAAINLFLPLITHPEASGILGRIKPDFAQLATNHLDNGYCIEYWGGNFDVSLRNTGPLADKSTMAGTDSDIAIAYRNHQGQLCLWLIEHKLTEKEFTQCGGYRSKGRQERHDCGKSFADLLADPAPCYYHDVRRFCYWEITRRHHTFFAGSDQHHSCPFQNGMNQLWRNQLLGMAIEEDPAYPFEQVSFSVVYHPENTALKTTLDEYQKLVADNPRFSVLTSDRFVDAAEQLKVNSLHDWAGWYRGLYRL